MDFAIAAIPFPEIDPFIFKIGPIGLRWYALAYIAGIILGWRYIVRLVRNGPLWGAGAKTAPMTGTQIDDFVAWATLGVIAGGRLGYVLFYQPGLLTEPWEPLFGFLPFPPALAIWQGGMSFHGGLIGVGLVTWLFARRSRIPTIRLMDGLACAAPIGLFFGRLANFINAELYGRGSDAPWAMVFPTDPDQISRHPSQLYEAALEGLVLFVVLRFASHHFKLLRHPGAMTGAFLLGYGLARSFVENFREPDSHLPDFPLGLTMGIMLSAPMIIGGAYLIWRGLRKTASASTAS